MKILEQYKKIYSTRKNEVYSLEEYLKKAKKDKSLYASPAERMLKAIGEPKLTDTAKDPKLSRIFGNKLIKTWDVFSEFYGLEKVIERIVSYFTAAAQGLEESKQILYFLGPVGSAKSSLAEKLKSLIEQEPIYVLADSENNLSPVNESPLGLFSSSDSEELGIPERYLEIKPSPWAVKRLEEYGGDLGKFTVVKLYPSQNLQIAVTKTEPGDENNQDISALVGKLDIRKLEFHAQDDPDAYNYSGGLCLGNRGVLEFVEMFKAPIKVLHPLLTATQEKNYKGTEAIGAIPFDGIVLAHSNQSEWDSFKNDKNNEAFLDRVCIVEVPYNLRVKEEVKIYKKLLNQSDLKDAPCAPGTLRILAEFCVLSRLDIDSLGDSTVTSKMKVYDGEHVKEKDLHAKSYQEYKDLASHMEGFLGVSTRQAYKIISEVYNYDPLEVAADPVHLFSIIDKTIKEQRYGEKQTEYYNAVLIEYLIPEYAKRIGKDIQTAYLDSYDEYGQALFDRYILYADYWIQDNDYRDPDTNQMFDRVELNKELEKIEKPAKVVNVKDFRHEVVNFALRYQAKHDGNNPKWTAYEKLRKVIEANMFSKTEDLLPIISFGNHKSSDDKSKHESFVSRMQELGYTYKQVQRLVEWHERYRKSR